MDMLDEVGKLNIKDNFKSSGKIKDFKTDSLWGYYIKIKMKNINLK